MEEAGSVAVQLAGDLSALNTLPNASLVLLIDLVVGFLVDPSENFQSALSSYAETNQVAAGVLKVLVRGLLVFLQGAMKDGVSSTQLGARCLGLGLQQDVVAAVVSCWQKSSSQMVSSLLAKTIQTNKLIDLDWSFGVTASSDDCDQVGKTFLQLKLTLESGEEGQGGTREVFMELSLEQFYHFLSSLEKCKTYLDLLVS